MKACIHADIQPDKSGRVVMRNSFRCLAPDPVLPPMPAAITSAYGFRWPPPRTHVFRDICAKCALYEARK